MSAHNGTPIEIVINALTVNACKPTKTSNGYEAHCPAHHDEHKSLSIGEGDDGRVLLTCHAASGCSFEQIVAELGLKQRDLFADDRSDKRADDFGTVTAQHVYTDEDGKPLLRVNRTSTKRFWQERFYKGGVYPGLKGTRRVLYRLPAVIKAIANGDTIYIVEGEKDADAGARAGVCATTCAMGAGKWNRKDYSETLRDARSIVIVADDDPEGEKHADQVARHLRRYGNGGEITITKAAEGKDLFDHLAAGHGIDELRVVAREQAAGNSDKEHSGGWESPVPLVGSAPLPKFPADALPDPLARYVADLARTTQTPPDLAGVMVLGALATAAGGRVVVEPRRGWREPTNLFLGAAMASGNRKTAVVQEVTDPLHVAERQAIDAARDGIREAQVQRDIAEQRARDAVKAAQSLADNATPKEKEEKATTAEDLRKMAEEITVPTMPRFLADDATPESLASLMAAQGGRIALISDEGGPFDMMAGRYSKVPNLDIYLKGHAGSHLRVDRQGREGQIIDRPALTVAVAFQPGILPKIAAGEGFRARGLIARFLFSVPHSFVGYREIGAAPMDDKVAEEYRTLIQALALSLADWTDPCVLTFSPYANDRLLEFERALEPRLAPGADLGTLADWGSKLAGAVVRIAGLLHLVAHLTNGHHHRPISESRFLAAKRIGEYFLAHAIAAHGLMGADEVVEDARHLLAWVKHEDVAHFTRRDAHKGNRAQFTRAADLDAPLERLEDHGWIRRRPDPEPGPQGGRPPSPTYDVNPAVTYSEDSQDSQPPPSPGGSEGSECSA
jgi:5S rRNA maturation endonuclease (ribonuclease M5)